MLLFLLFSLIWGVCLAIIPNNIKIRNVVMILGTLVLYWGYSYTNAPDTEGYMDFFEMISRDGWVLDSLYGSAAGNMEPGTFIIMQLCKRVSESYFFFQFVILTIDIMLTYWGLRKMSENRLEPVVFFLLFTFIVPFYLSALRQGVVIAIMTFCLPLFRDNKWYFYIPLLILAIFFHQTAILVFAIPILMFLFSKIKIKQESLQKFFFVVFVVFNICYVFGISADGLVEKLFGEYVYDSSLSTNREMRVENMEISEFGILKMVEVNVCYIIFFFSKLVKKDDTLRLFGIMFLLFFVLNTLAGGIIIHRLTYYLRIPYYFVLFESLRSLMVNGMKMKHTPANLIIYFYMFALYMDQSVLGSKYIFEYHLFDAL